MRSLTLFSLKDKVVKVEMERTARARMVKESTAKEESKNGKGKDGKSKDAKAGKGQDGKGKNPEKSAGTQLDAAKDGEKLKNIDC